MSKLSGPLPMVPGSDLDESEVAEAIELEEAAAAEAWDIFTRAKKAVKKKRPKRG